jgi:predicted permease
MTTRDLRQTLRLVGSQPALSAAIVGMLALGIGATTAIFSVVYGVLLRPLPFPEPDRIFEVSGVLPDRGWTGISLTEANFWDLQERNHTFEALGALHFDSFSLTGFEYPERVSAGRVTVGFFRALGVRPVAGTLFEPGEDAPGQPGTLVLLSHTFWMRRFAGDTSVVGRSLTLDDRPHTIRGVLPPGSPLVDIADLFIPMIRRVDADRGSFEYTAVGRLKDGVTEAAAAADLSAISADLAAKYPATNRGLGAMLEPSRTWIASDDLRRTLWMLLGSVGLLLLIACVNVTNLLLARASARTRDHAVRTALGASRSDLVRERLAESFFYSIAGTILGWLVARGMLAALLAINPGGIPRLAEVSLNGWVVLFSAGMALLVGLLTGLVPALRAPLADIVSALRQGQRGSAGDQRHSRTRSLFVGAEVALSLILLVGAGLLVRSLLTVLSIDRGFQTENRLLATITIPSSYGEERMRQTGQAILERVAGMPEVVSAATVSGRPLSRGSTGLGFAAADQPDTSGTAVPWATWRIVSNDYFKAVGLPLIAGRTFTDQDVIGKPWRAVISKRIADMLWPGQNAVGKTIILWKGQGDRRGEVIGVVGNMRERGLEADPTMAVYLPTGGTARDTLQVVLHTKAGAEAVIPAFRAAVGSVDRNLPISGIRTLDDIVTASVATRRMTMLLIVSFAILALVLALAGVYGVLAYSVARRTPEIGVRLALGAEPRGVIRMIVAQGMRPVIAGVLIGLAATFWVTRLMANLLFGVQPYDLATYAGVVASLTVIAVLACYVPARRVLRVDPVVALRAE